MTRQADIRSYQGKRPQIAASAYIDPACVIIGDVVIGEDSSVWPLCVIRGDVNHIRIGARTNIQDGSIIHVMKDEYPTLLADDITIGHAVTLHGCTIESRCLIGMRATILNGAVIGKGSIIAAGTLVLERTIIPPASLVVGSPGKVKRTLNPIDQAAIDRYAERYVQYKNIYMQEVERSGEWRVASGEQKKDE
ncbi:MAG TPA: gamma carbonic anhydrase family protein [Candidatus Dormibacteraeota bacterium]|nr:gamma carbonic anhydrase family protein [Candidatus Dormibacteraeota bacterium]